MFCIHFLLPHYAIQSVYIVDILFDPSLDLGYEQSCTLLYRWTNTILSYIRTNAEASKVVPEKLIETLYQSHLQKFVEIYDPSRIILEDASASWDYTEQAAHCIGYWHGTQIMANSNRAHNCQLSVRGSYYDYTCID